MTIAIYSRKSKFTGKGESIENQIKKCKEFIRFKFEIDPENIEIFIDEGFSGKNENRPRYQDMLTKIKNKDIDKIVIYQLNRLGRNARDIHNTMQMCDDLDTIIYSATEGFDSSTSFGRAIIGILASLAQLEREQLAERVKDNMYTLAKMGRWLGGQSPLGFDGSREYYLDENGKERSITKLKKNDKELKIVKSIYDKYLSEKSLSQVSKWSLSNCLTGKNGGNLDKSAINTILQNPVYVKSNAAVFEFLESKGFEVCGEPNGNGILRYGKDSIAAVGKHKGVISADTWLNVQEILKENTVKAPALGKTHTALLTGILKCGCGSPMRVTHGGINKDGIKTFYYTCTMKNNSGGTRCNSKNINGLLLEEKFINYLKNYNKDNLIMKLKAISNEINEESKIDKINELNKAIQLKENSIKQLLNKLKLIDDDDVSKIILDEITFEKNSIKTLTSQREDLLNAESNNIINISEINNLINALQEFNETQHLLTLEQRQKAIRTLVESVIYVDGNFDIKFVKKNLDNFLQFGTSYRSYNYRFFSWTQFSKKRTRDSFINASKKLSSW